MSWEEGLGLGTPSEPKTGIGEPPLRDTRFRYFPIKKTSVAYSVGVQIDQISLSHFCKTCFSTLG